MSSGKFWLEQDKVPSDVIKAFTNTCNREDCKISFRMGETTCMGVKDHYDKNGNLIIIDGNRFGGEITCGTCWDTANITNKGVITNKRNVANET